MLSRILTRGRLPHFLLCILVIMRSYYLLASAAALQTVIAVQPVVHLNYTSYRGTALNNGITQWLGMRFAAPPLGDLRFRPPQSPASEAGVQDADAFGPICIGTGSGPPNKVSSPELKTMHQGKLIRWNRKWPRFVYSSTSLHRALQRKAPSSRSTSSSRAVVSTRTATPTYVYYI
jgi:hypothetical protein